MQENPSSENRYKIKWLHVYCCHWWLKDYQHMHFKVISIEKTSHHWNGIRVVHFYFLSMLFGLQTFKHQTIIYRKCTLSSISIQLEWNPLCDHMPCFPISSDSVSYAMAHGPWGTTLAPFQHRFMRKTYSI